MEINAPKMRRIWWTRCRTRKAVAIYLGRMIGGEFAVVGLIGIGGFGSVYRGIRSTGRTVALKILHDMPIVARRYVDAL